MQRELILNRSELLLNELCTTISRAASFSWKDSEYLLERLEEVKEFIRCKTVTKKMATSFVACPVCKKFTKQLVTRYYAKPVLKAHLDLFHRPNYQNIDQLPYVASESPESPLVDNVVQYYNKKYDPFTSLKYCDVCREMCGRINFARHVASDCHKENVAEFKNFSENKFIDQNILLADLVEILIKKGLSRSMFKHLRPFLTKYTGRAFLSESGFNRFYCSYIDSLPDERKKLILYRKQKKVSNANGEGDNSRNDSDHDSQSDSEQFSELSSQNFSDNSRQDLFKNSPPSSPGNYSDDFLEDTLEDSDDDNRENAQKTPKPKPVINKKAQKSQKKRSQKAPRKRAQKRTQKMASKPTTTISVIDDNCELDEPLEKMTKWMDVGEEKDDQNDQEDNNKEAPVDYLLGITVD